jgi:DNA-binding transcriptional LysR family regulator
MRRVMRVWNRLPAFRAVAETEHLTQAAHELHVTPPALSRTLKLLEDDLGTILFTRRNNHLLLNASGRQLLDATRTAIRLVHDALADLERAPDHEVRIASSEPFTAAALDGTLARLLTSHPHLCPHVVTTVPDDPVPDLLQGRLDVVFTDRPRFRPDVATVTLGAAASAVYCGPGHALHGCAEVSLVELSRHGFAAPCAGRDGEPRDGWPRAWSRKVNIVIDGSAVALAFCLRGHALAVLPVTVATEHPHLHRVPLDLPAPARMYAMLRQTVGRAGPAEVLVDHARATLAGCPGWQATAE